MTEPKSRADYVRDLEAEVERLRAALGRIAAPDSTFWEANMARQMAGIARETLASRESQA